MGGCSCINHSTTMLFQEAWLSQDKYYGFKGRGGTHAYCKLCKKPVDITKGGSSNLDSHQQARSLQQRLDLVCQIVLDDKSLDANILWCFYVGKHEEIQQIMKTKLDLEDTITSLKNSLVTEALASEGAKGKDHATRAASFAKSLVEKENTKKDLGEIQEKLEKEFATML